MPKVIRNKLSPVKVKALTSPGVFTDGGGLYLQVTPSGTQSWIYRFMINGRARTMGLGPVVDVSLKEARELASAARAKVRAGIDPIEEKHGARRAAQVESGSSITFRKAAEQFIAAKEAEWKNLKHKNQWANTLETYAHPVLGELPVGDITTEHVLRVIQPIWTTKNETAARVRGRIEAILDSMSARGFRDGDNPARWKGHLDKLLPKRSKVRTVEHHRALPYSQAKEFMSVLGAREGVSARCLEVTMLTAARTQEVIAAQWSEVDFGTNTWTIPAERMKAKREQRVPLSPAAVAALTQMKGMHATFVFPGDSDTGHLSDGAMAELLKEIGEFDTTVHGLRSTFRDWASEISHYPNEVCEAALAHVIKDQTEAAYRRGDLFDKRRRLMEDWAAFLEKPRSSAAV